MKRIISALLCLLLTLSLTLPAYGYEDTDPPQWQEWGFDSLEECVEYYYDGDLEAYYEDISYEVDYANWKKAHDAEIQAFDPDKYWAEEYWAGDYYQSKEDYMLEMGFESEEELNEYLLDDYLWEMWWADETAKEVAESKKALGGVPGQLGVMLDGSYLKFDAQPELKDGRTMVPCRQVLEAMGGTVSYEDGMAVCRLKDASVTAGGKTVEGDAALYFKAGSDVVIVRAGGQELNVQMDAKCYFKNGRTYIPVRFFAQTLGCDVFYDSLFETAVLLNRQALVDEVDSSFTVLNRLLKSLARDPSKNYRTAASLGADLTLLDSINGNKTYNMDASLELVQSADAASVTGRLDLAALGKLEEFDQLFAGMTSAQLSGLKSALANVKFKLIYDGKEGMMYLNLPLLAYLPETEFAEDDWVAIPAMGLNLNEGASSVGSLIYTSATGLSGADEGGVYYNAVHLYQEIQEYADEAAVLLGDGCFQGEGGYDVLHYGMEDYQAYLKETYGEDADYYNEFNKLSADLRIARDGAATFKVEMQSQDAGYFIPVMLVTADGKVSSTGVNMNLVMKLKNTMDLEIRYTASTSETQQTPGKLPADANVINSYGYDEEPLPAEETIL
ncbi:copper amine oxidase N-terminal domain-containing protein [Oscillibacter sp. MSJ-2]|uniref:Copper amine oxidase N-terminal domain-containing protein n=1 Tax=Dysosmobacter acutus TaxID=2841504 RepID=A0ABS6F5K6_9FIRM|nr:copper amine oxidase N-terminal domain-containing protein [Dysosmobacter acutus]MBU5625551.1 copper amine oxidase N-terminal domain-containing protein [Dysosmobacter acutus]